MENSKAWPCAGNRAEKMGYLFKTGELSDAFLYVGKSPIKKVEVHRFVLEFASPVFHKLFQKAIKDEKYEVNLGVDISRYFLNIPDSDPDIFMKFIRYLYANEFENGTVEEYFQLLELATKYEVSNLMDLCKLKLFNGDCIDIENFGKSLEKALEVGHKGFIDYVLAFICRNGSIVAESYQFLKLSPKCLVEILKRDDLQVQSELQLFTALIRWGKMECRMKHLKVDDTKNIQKLLTDLIGFIRFPLMTAEEFSLNVLKQCVLVDQDVIALFQHFTTPVEKRGLIPIHRFNTTPRNYTPLEKLTLNAETKEVGSKTPPTQEKKASETSTSVAVTVIDPIPLPSNSTNIIPSGSGSLEILKESPSNVENIIQNIDKFKRSKNDTEKIAPEEPSTLNNLIKELDPTPKNPVESNIPNIKISDLFPPGPLVEIFITNASMPNSFHFQVKGEGTAELKKLLEEMAEFYPQPYPEGKGPVVGDIVAAFLTTTPKKIVRAKVIYMLDNNKVNVHCVDTGSSLIVNLAKISPIHPDFLALPFQAILGRMNLGPIERFFSCEAIEDFRSLAAFSPHRSNMARLDQNYKVNGYSCIEIFNGPLNIGEELIRTNRAKRLSNL